MNREEIKKMGFDEFKKALDSIENVHILEANGKEVYGLYKHDVCYVERDGIKRTLQMIVPEMKERVDNMMSMLDAVVGLVIASAAALAFIVLFNLSNINITERVREIATIKVLGFYPHETGTYVFRENLVLSLMGIIIGLPLGIWLHKYVIAQINVDMVSFAVKIKPASYVICCVIVLLFLFFVDLVMRRKIDAINMAESLKSVE